MIPENRVDNGSFPIPKLLIDKEDIALFMEEFKGFHAQFADCFSREEPRKKITMIQQSSIDGVIVKQVYAFARYYKNVLVILDSNHIHEHVLAELNNYAPLVSKGSYCVVFDTIIEDLPDGVFPDRPWGKGNNPKTAV